MAVDLQIYYDPMIAKLVTFGKDRNEAIEKMLRAIDEYQITGIETTLPFGKYVLTHEAFISGNFDTKFIERYFTPDVLKEQTKNDEVEIAAALAAMLMDKKKPDVKANVEASAVATSNWKKNRLN